MNRPTVLFGLIWLVVAVNTGHGEDWPQWGGPRGDFTVVAGDLAETWPASGPPRLWRRPLGKGYSSIVARDGKLYTMYRQGSREVIAALDAATGKTLWLDEQVVDEFWPDMVDYFGLGPNGTPLILGQRLIAIGITGQMRCLDLGSGKLLWERNLPALYGRRERVEEYGYSASPLAYEGLILVAVGGQRHAVVAFDGKTGATAWQSDGGGISYAQPSLTRLADRDHYLYFSPAGIEALDPASGRRLWSAPIEFNNGNHLTPAVRTDDHHLWVGSQFESGGGRLLEIVQDAERLSAHQRWFDAELQTSHWTMIQRGDMVYGSTGSNRRSRLTAFDWRTGKVAWHHPGFHKAQALWADDKLLFLDETGQLVLAKVSPKKLELLATAQMTSGDSWTLPTLVGTVLYLRDQQSIQAVELGKQPNSPKPKAQSPSGDRPEK